MATTAQTAIKHAFVYPFGAGITTPPLDSALLGGKGKGLAEMASIGLPVPPGFILSTEACFAFLKNGRKLTPEMKDEIHAAMEILEKKQNSKFGDQQHPFLVSVRSGARVSMPGMMDTILNLGLNDKSVEGYAALTGNPRLAYDCYRRLIMMYSEIVHGVSRRHFEDAFRVIKQQQGVHLDNELSVENLKRICVVFKQVHDEYSITPFPQDAYEQLYGAIAAVFNSWDSERAILYRHLNRIPDDWGTAVNVQTMVFGNKNDNSATGVAFTRDPASGMALFYGEFLSNAQGEEVVAGTRTPQPINTYQKQTSGSELISLEEAMPKVYKELHENVLKLERHYRDMQDIEFTIDDGKLYMLQTRTGKRTGFAAVRMAVEMMKEGLIDDKTALLRVQPNQITQLLAPVFDARAKSQAANFLVAKGLNAGPGAASGKAVFTSQRATEYAKKGIHTILVREEASPDDFPGMVAAQGILTLRGGATSHAAVVARGMGKPCVVGCAALHLNERAQTLSCGEKTIKEGDPISIDGMTGEVYFCELTTSPSEIVQVLITRTKSPEESLLFQEYEILMKIADKYKKLEVRANADTPYDSAVARSFGAQGIGLCRTEHMFMDMERLNDVRCMFFSTRYEERKAAISKLLPHQKNDFIGIFKAMEGLPVTIRLLDPPLHEFMPHNFDELNALAQLMNINPDELSHIRDTLQEVNPMLGHRGCRLGITYPELTEMQARAVFEAAIEVHKSGKEVFPEIMVPLVGTIAELEHQRMIIENTAKEVFKQKGVSIGFTIGTMIELPRACIIADKIALKAAFFSFGTNDLTQTTFGISRDDSAKFVPSYVSGVPNPDGSKGIFKLLPADPFQELDQEGVGELMKIAIQKGKSTNPNLHLGICGEHGGDPHSVEFFHKLGLDYVSCSPYRVPVARLAAGRAALQ
ncbi:MAG: pyruvate, phosphate dikinase [Parachlamydiales bacterium]|jgi:pyruvate,orthophosphate dikinase